LRTLLLVAMGKPPFVLCCTGEQSITLVLCCTGEQSITLWEGSPVEPGSTPGRLPCGCRPEDGVEWVNSWLTEFKNATPGLRPGLPAGRLSRGGRGGGRVAAAWRASPRLAAESLQEVEHP
jgi:hypothetical protein